MEKKCERENMSAIDTERMKNLKKMRETLIYDAYYLQAENYLKHGKMAISKPRVDMFLDQCSRLQEEDSYSFRWEDRMKVATQLATLFIWLHEKQFAIGRMEPSSIMIDKDFNMKVIDFPFLVRVRDIPHNILPDAPEADNVTETLKDDVYAFDILLLRLITNNKNIEGLYHCWIREELQGGKGSIVDKSVLLNCDGVLACGITKLATECLDEDPNARPDMKNVSDRLTNLLEVNYSVKRRLAEIHSPGYKCELVGYSFWIRMSEIGFEQRQVCVAISERPGEQFGQTRMISVLTLALAVGVVGFLLFKKH